MHCKVLSGVMTFRELLPGFGITPVLLSRRLLIPVKSRGLDTRAVIQNPHGIRLLVLVLLVLVFAALYPYLDATGSCGEPGCPHFSHVSTSVELPAEAMVALLRVVPAARAFAGLAHRPASDRKPAEIYLSPEPDPPRF